MTDKLGGVSLVGLLVVGALWSTSCRSAPSPQVVESQKVQIASSQATPNPPTDSARQVRVDLEAVKEQTTSIHDNELQRARDLQSEIDAKLAKLDAKSQADTADIFEGITLRLDMAASRIEPAKDRELESGLKALRTKTAQASAASGKEQAGLYTEVMVDLEILETAVARLRTKP